MILRYQYRLYPTRAQEVVLAKTFGCARVVYNDYVAEKERAFKAGEKSPSCVELQKKLITEAKNTEERHWLSEVSNISLQQSIRGADNAYRNFFAGVKAKRRVGKPRFKSRRDNRQSFRLTRNGFRIRGNGRLNLARIGEVRVRWSRELPSEPSSVTIVKNASGKYFASFVVETQDEKLPVIEDVSSFDLGLSVFATDHNGDVIKSPRFAKKAERRLRKAQRNLSRKQRGSNNRNKARIKVARAHEKVRNQRFDFLHKVTTTMVRENQGIIVEDLNVKGLSRSRLSKSFVDASLGTFYSLLEYKASRYGRVVHKVDRFFPSSKMCHCCKAIQDMPLSVRVYSCPCGSVLDRDHNAALNLIAVGLTEIANACGETVRPKPARASARLDEARIPSL